MRFLEIQTLFESKISASFRFELLELHYLPYCFGNGSLVYRIHDYNIKIVFNGKDGWIETYITAKHQSCSPGNNEYSCIFNDIPDKFFDIGFSELVSKLKEE
jgi:hypothetical protein